MQSPLTATRTLGPRGRRPAWILEHGTPCIVVIGAVAASGVANLSGEAMYALDVTVIAPGRTAYEVRIGAAVPGEGLALVALGARLPARRMPHGEDVDLVIDWALAIDRRAVRPA